MNDDERRRTAFLNYAKALLRHCEDKGDLKGAERWKKEIEMLGDEAKPFHACTNYEQGKCKKKNGGE